jgi:CheY-like chemotaxis protein
MHILLLEDSSMQAELIHSGLAEAFRSATITTLGSEAEFRQYLPQLLAAPPDIGVFDVMVRSTDPSPDMLPPPIDVVRDGYFRAGLRCQRILQCDDRTKNIPIVLFTVLESIDLEHELLGQGKWVHVRKVSSLSPLIQEVHRFTGQSG